MSFIFTSIPSLTRPLTFDSDCESFFGQLPAYQINLEALAAQCEQNATTLLSMSEIEAYFASNGMSFSVNTKGLIFSDGTKVQRDSTGGLRIIPPEDNWESRPRIRNAANNSDVLVLSPASDATALAGLSPNEPIVPSSLNHVLENRVSCRAWVLFNGFGAIAIRGSANVSSISDLGTGRYRVNLTGALQDVNAAAVASATNATTGLSLGDWNNSANAVVSSTTAVDVSAIDASNTFSDHLYTSVIINR